MAKLSWRKLRKYWRVSREKPDIWLLDREKLAYIQIPKVATRSIRTCLATHLLNSSGVKVNSDELSNETISVVDQAYSLHVPLKRIAQNYVGQYYLIAFVRDPFERLYSCYYNKIVDPVSSGKRNIFADYGIELGISFADFVKKIVQIPDRYSDRHFRTQCSFLVWQGKLLPDYLGRLETFAEDWRVVTQRFGLPEVPIRNRSDNSVDIASVYDKDLLALVFDRYRMDVELLGYRSQYEILREKVV